MLLAQKPRDVKICHVERGLYPLSTLNHKLDSLGIPRTFATGLMISWVILDCEREYIQRGYANANHEQIRRRSPIIRERNEKIGIKAFKDNWYRFVLYKIASECKESSRLKKNKVRFVTFNYDVSLETYLYKGLRQIEFMKKYETDIKGFLQDRFVHMYGQIRDDPLIDPVPVIEASPSDKRIKNYRRILDDAYHASKSIRTIGDSKNNPDAISIAREMIEWAEDVYILGYGFDKNNSMRLNLGGLLPASKINELGKKENRNIKKRIYFTNFNDHNSVNKKASKVLVGNTETFLRGKDAIHRGPLRAYTNADVVYEKSTRNVYDALEQDFDFF